MEEEREEPVEVVDTAEDEQDPDLEGAEAKPKPSKLKVKFAAELHRDEAFIYFQSILDGLRKGKLQLKQGDKLLQLAPAESLEIEVKAAKKADKEKLSIELSWTDSTDDLEVSS